MAPMLRRASDRMHPNPLLDGLVAGKANVRSELKSDETRPVFRAYRLLVREAMRSVGLSQKAFAIDADTTESAVSDALAGARQLPAEWVWAQTNDAFQHELHALEAAERGLTTESQRMSRANLIAECVRQLLLLGERRDGAVS